jgi:predicted esterase
LWEGASIALDAALHYSKVLGGVVCKLFWNLCSSKLISTITGISDSLLDEYIESDGEDILPKVKKELPILITHGTKDDRVPVKRAQQKVCET